MGHVGKQGNQLGSNMMLRPMAKRESSSDSIQTTNTTTSSDILGLGNDIKPSNYKTESLFNLETVYKNNTKYATQSVLPPNDYHSPYYIPFKNIDDPRPVDQLIYRFSIWKMIIKQIIFYFKEMSVFKSQTFQGNRAMLENLEILRRQNSGRLKVKVNSNKNLKKSLSSNNLKDEEYSNLNTNNNNSNSNNNNNLSHSNLEISENQLNLDQQNIVNRLLQTTFLPPGDNSILSISSTFFNNHNYLKEKELLTYQHLTNRLIPRLENLKDQLNETIRQMNSIKNASDYKTKNLKMEIAKTGGILSDYITSIELLKTGHSKSSLGTTINLKENEIDSRLDPYILKLKLDLQLKDQLYIEAHLKEMYYDLQFKAVQLEKILYTEIQSCISAYTDLIDSELNAVKDNLILPFKQGFVRNDPTIDWDYFIQNDKKKNFLPINAKNTLSKVKQVRKNSDIIYPYRNNVISSCIYSGYLERKSKYLKNYSKFYYVLTINFLHEFKTNDRIKDLTPIQSFSLNDLTVSIVETDPKKFVLRIYKHDSKENSKAKYTFKCDSIDSTLKWIDYLSDLTEFDNTIERNISYDVNDDDEDDDDKDDETYSVEFQNEQNNFIDSSSSKTTSPISNIIPLASPSIDNFSILSSNHSRSISDELYKSQYQQIQNSLQHQQQQQQKSPQDDYFNFSSSNNHHLSNIAFKSIKSQPNMRQSSTSTIPVSNTSGPNSRTSSRSSSRASSPNRGRISRPPSILLSPKLGISTPTGVTSVTPIGISTVSESSTNIATGSGDYFSYAPRKVQASIIRNGNRLASTNSGRLTPNGGSNNNNGLAINVSLNKSATNLSVPKINIHESSPINTEKPTDIDFNFENPGQSSSSSSSSISGLERRRKTLSEKLDITGLVSANNKNNNVNSFLKFPHDFESSHSIVVGLPETPGIIPGSKMNQLFDSNSVTDDTPILKKEFEN
jgi:hypothetical protein